MRRNDLHVSTFDHSKGRAQTFVSTHDFVDASLQDKSVDRGCQSERVKDVAKRNFGQRLLQFQQPFLRSGGPHPLFAGGVHDGGGTSLSPVGMDQRIEMASHLRNRRHLENARDPNLEMQDVANAGENVYGRERVTAQREEVVMDTDPFDLEDLGPEFRQHLLEVRLRRDEGLLRDDKVREPQLCRQADTLHFACWALWELLNDVHLARDLEVGEAPDGKLANVCRGRRRMGPQYDGRRDVLA